MINFLKSVTNLYLLIKESKKVEFINSQEFKKLSHNDKQKILFRSLKKAGLKPILTQYLYPPIKGEIITIDQINTNSGCKVSCCIVNLNSSLLLLYLTGPNKLIEEYHHKLAIGTYTLLSRFGIAIELRSTKLDNSQTQIIISHYLSPVTNVVVSIEEILKVLR